MTVLTDSVPGPASRAAFVLILLTPLLFPGFFPFDVNLLLAVTAALLFISCLLLELRFLYLPRGFLVALTIVLALQLIPFASGNLPAPESWRLQTIGYLTAAAMLMLGASAPAASLRTWMRLYLCLALPWSAIGLYVWLGGTQGTSLTVGWVTIALPAAVKLAGPFNQGNIFAAAIGFAWIFAHWLFITERRYIYAAAIVFFTAMFFDSMSRGGWLAYAPALALLLYALRPKAAFCLRRLLPLWLAGLALGYLCLIYSQPQVASGQMAAIPSAESSLEARLIYWASAIFEFLGAPWTGVGWGQFGAEFWSANPQAQAWFQQHTGWSYSPYTNALSAHNLVLHALAEGGLLTALLVVWGIWRVLRACLAWIGRPNSSARLPFALAALGFLLQSQVNVVYTHYMPLLMAAFFTGIALAPWLRGNSRRLALKSPLRGTVWVVTTITAIWAIELSSQWFHAENALRQLDLDDRASVSRLAAFTATPRVGTLASAWLGYRVAKEEKHSALLVWMLPYLQETVHEIPSVGTYQILFVAQLTAREYGAACRLGQIISRQRFPNETNNAAYAEVCENRMPSRYKIGN